MSTHYRWDRQTLSLKIRVAPRSSLDQVGELMGDRLKIAITAPPVDGKANQHLTRYIAKLCSVPKSSVTVMLGKSSRDKTVRIVNPTCVPDEFQVGTSPP